jgi:hypothetical protein
MNGQLGVCQRFKDEIDRMEGEIKLLGQQLLTASPSQKRAIRAKINSLVLDEQLTSQALDQCLDDNPILVAIFCDPFDAVIPLGVVQQFTAVGSFLGHVPHGQDDLTASVTWASSEPSVATISNDLHNNSKGQATSVSQGTTTITATLGSLTGTATLRVGLVSITVTPSHAQIIHPGSINLGDFQQQFIAIGTFADSNTRPVTASVHWTANPSDKATISSQGLAIGVVAGATTITAATRNAGPVVSGTAMLTVVE